MASTEEKQENNACFDFLYNNAPDGKPAKVLGRTAFEWGRITLFYICFFGALTAWIIMLMAIFYETLDYLEPKYYGDNSLQLGNPGLGLRPQPWYKSTLIRFQQGNPSSYKPYTDHLEAFLMNYEKEYVEGKDVVDCGGANTGSPVPNEIREQKQACRIDLDSWAGNTPCIKQRDFGFEEGRPCLALKMNKMYGFTPDPYESVPELLQDQRLVDRPRFLTWKQNHVGVSCEGMTAADRENLNEVKYYPEGGFSEWFYPYVNQEGYRSPFMFVQFTNITKRVVIQVTCKLYDKNINNDGGTRRHGAIHFELLRD